MNLCRQCRVRGRVQGVFFRDSTRHEAQRLGLTGYARNLADGSVEVLVCGSDAGVRQLCDWLQEGPPMAQVDQVDCETVDIPPPSHFTTE
ncbi:MAG: acylphosphatase [Thiohalophilus sp.]